MGQACDQEAHAPGLTNCDSPSSRKDAIPLPHCRWRQRQGHRPYSLAARQICRLRRQACRQPYHALVCSQENDGRRPQEGECARSKEDYQVGGEKGQRRSY